MKSLHQKIFFTLLLAALSFSQNSCSAISSLVGTLLGQCQNFSSDELNISLNQQCRDLTDFFSDATDNLDSFNSILSVNTQGSITDASLLITDSSGDPLSGLTTSTVTAQASNDNGTSYHSVTVSSVDQYSNLANTESATTNLAVATIIDYSASILSSDLTHITDALAFFYNNLGGLFKGEVIKFSTDVDVIQSFTTTKTSLVTAVQDTDYDREMTSIYDAVYKGVTDLSAETAPLRVAILFTDGEDNDSSHSYAETKTLFQDENIPVCVVGVGFAPVSDLQTLASDSGCFYIYNPFFTSLDTVFETVTNQLNGLYRVRFNASDLTGANKLKLIITHGGTTSTPTYSL